MMRCASLILVTFTLATVACGAEPLADDDRTAASPPKDPAKFHIYLLMGQSNMVGMNQDGPEDHKTNPRILSMNLDGKWELARDPLHYWHGRSEHRHYNGTGPGYPFAKAMLAAGKDPDVVIGLIPAGWGGRTISKWLPDDDWAKTTRQRAIEAAKVGTIKGILWHQGESNSQRQSDIDRYAGQFRKLVAWWREQLHDKDLPFVAGELGHFDYADQWKGCPKINAVLREVIPTLKRVALVSSAGLKDKGDRLHFSAEAQREFGQRYAKVMLRLQGKLDDAGEAEVKPAAAKEQPADAPATQPEK